MPVNVVNIFEVGDYESHLDRAAEALRKGGLVIVPTETVYGAAGLLSHDRALVKLRALRNGGVPRPFTVHIARRTDASRYLGDLSELGRRMMRKLWPGPVALTFDVPERRRGEVTREVNVDSSDLFDESSGTITLRCPDHIVATDLLTRVDGPVALSLVEASTSPDGVVSFAPGALEQTELALSTGPARYSKPSTIVRVRDNSWEIVRSGIFDQRIIERMLRTTVLFVCSGNTCRSPMAEALARTIIAERMQVAPAELEAKGYSVLSAGSFAMPGARATPQAVEAVRALGADLSAHRSRPLSVELIHQADVIFAMGRSHTAAIVGLVPSASEKTTTLDPRGDIEDPIGGDASLYKDLAVKLRGLIERRLHETVLKPG